MAVNMMVEYTLLVVSVASSGVAMLENSAAPETGGIPAACRGCLSESCWFCEHEGEPS